MKIERKVDRLYRLIEKGKNDVRDLAYQILASVPEKDQDKETLALYTWVKENIRFARDPKGLESFESARKTLSWRAGDCDAHTVLLGSLLTSVGHQVMIRVAGAPPAHVYLMTPYLGNWTVIDPTITGPIGTEAPLPNKITYEAPKKDIGFLELGADTTPPPSTTTTPSFYEKYRHYLTTQNILITIGALILLLPKHGKPGPKFKSLLLELDDNSLITITPEKVETTNKQKIDSSFVADLDRLLLSYNGYFLKK